MTGQTKSVGFQAGKRKTFDTSSERLWRLLCSAEGQELLGQRPQPLEVGVDGVSTLSEGSHYRQVITTRQGLSALLQVRVVPAGRTRATLALHVEKLGDAAQRDEYLGLFDSALTAFERSLDKARP